MKPTFLVLTDLSVSARRAAYLTAVLAREVGGQVVLLHLEQLPVMEPELGLVVVPDSYYTQLEHDAKAALRELARQLPAPVAVEFSTESLPDVLGDVLGRWQPQLLVMGLAPAHDVVDALLVNQVVPVLRDAGLPLLLVPDGAAQDPAPPQLVAVATDGDPFQLTPAARALRPLLHRWSPDYCVVHVATPDSPNGSEEALSAVRGCGLLPETASCISYEVQQQPRTAGIVQAVHDVQADLLVLMTRPRTFLSSVFGCGVAAHVASASPVPVLLLPTVESSATG
ncbi:universal stress protein [Hymenobacter koreensis]|uniref:UspA domain-containing protein n=1 Tax=Hymenobacter koreensis TaxID=1084523 RepID=A0ABP8J682_9BACT